MAPLPSDWHTTVLNTPLPQRHEHLCTTQYVLNLRQGLQFMRAQAPLEHPCVGPHNLHSQPFALCWLNNSNYEREAAQCVMHSCCAPSIDIHEEESSQIKGGGRDTTRTCMQAHCCCMHALWKEVSP